MFIGEKKRLSHFTFPPPLSLRSQIHKDDLEARLEQVQEMESTLTLNVKELDQQRQKLEKEAREHEEREEAVMKRMQSADEVRLLEVIHPSVSL